MVSAIRITFLVDNNASETCGSEHGLSLLIEAECKVLFDVGQSRLFLDNAQQLGRNLDDIDAIVLSHGHYDHGNGLEHISGHRLITHPQCFTRRYRSKNDGYIGLKFDRAWTEKNFRLELSDMPAAVSSQITYLGHVPRNNSFECQNTDFTDENGNADFVPDDSGVVIRTSEGLIIISGCAHAGICNTIDHAMKLTSDRRIVAVIGGFHLKEGSAAIEPTISYLKQLAVGQLFPCHCVDNSVMEHLHKELACQRVYAGLTLNFKA